MVQKEVPSLESKNLTCATLCGQCWRKPEWSSQKAGIFSQFSDDLFSHHYCNTFLKLN